MERVKVFKNNKSQAVRLPKPVSLLAGSRIFPGRDFPGIIQFAEVTVCSSLKLLVGHYKQLGTLIGTFSACFKLW
ncbi:MAG: hypothetical protein OXH71_02110 [Candidatus Dadabacteria bacterium]|nr:hypothetical protein [Candidatus Dadabacteria bacterium]MDE0519476.1 hypothetical protein [Candidatus Dadabacteria bacterium]MDE0663285.1 hypothetical protein [Candidatus Dadabacteria bacterium]